MDSTQFDDLFIGKTHPPSVEEVLDHENVLLEARMCNEFLIKFFTENKQNFMKLVDLVTRYPSNTLEKSKAAKFPFIASEIFTIESSIMHGFFIDWNTNTPSNRSQPRSPTPIPGEGSKAMLSYLLAFVDSKQPLDSTLAWYFQKTLSSLMSIRMSDIEKFIFEERPQFIAGMINHIACPPIADLLGKFIASKTSIYDKAYISPFENHRLKLLEQIISEKLVKDAPEEEVRNITAVITQALNLAPPVFAMRIKYHLLSDPCHLLLIKALESNLNNKAMVKSCIKILEPVMIPLPQENQDMMGDKDDFQKLQTLCRDMEVGAHRRVLEKYGIYAEYLLGEDKMARETVFKSKAKPFGLHRLHVFEFIANFYVEGPKGIHDDLLRIDFFSLALKLFRKYEWNNLLHDAVRKVIVGVIENGSHELKTKLFHDARLVNQLKEALEDEYFAFSKPQSKKIKHGYIGYVIRLGDLLRKKQGELEKYLTPDWEDLYKRRLAPLIKREDEELGKTQLLEKSGSRSLTQEIKLDEVWDKHEVNTLNAPMDDLKNAGLGLPMKKWGVASLIDGEMARSMELSIKTIMATSAGSHKNHTTE